MTRCPLILYTDYYSLPYIPLICSIDSGALLPHRNNWTPPPESNITAFEPVIPIGKSIWLYNITADPNEWNDVSDKNPSVVKKMLDRLEEYHKTMVPPMWPAQDPKCDPANHGGVWGPWE